MYRIIERRMIVPNLHEFTVEAPAVAQSVKPGNFVIVRADQYGERIPLSVADWDRQAGTVTSIFMQVGGSTARLARLKPGDTIQSEIETTDQDIDLLVYELYGLTEEEIKIVEGETK
jgi:ferredoxin--NADP+ reductase